MPEIGLEVITYTIRERLWKLLWDDNLNVKYYCFINQNIGKTMKTLECTKVKWNRSILKAFRSNELLMNKFRNFIGDF